MNSKETELLNLLRTKKRHRREFYEACEECHKSGKRLDEATENQRVTDHHYAVALKEYLK